MKPTGLEHEERKSLREWAKILGIPAKEMMFERHYYPDTLQISKWEANVALRRWNGLEMETDPTDKAVDVELTLRAKVRVTAAMRQGIKEQYSLTEEDMWNDEKIGEMILYASINPGIPQDNKDFDDNFDGIGNMRGLITNTKLGD